MGTQNPTAETEKLQIRELMLKVLAQGWELQPRTCRRLAALWSCWDALLVLKTRLPSMFRQLHFTLIGQMKEVPHTDFCTKFLITSFPLLSQPLMCINWTKLPPHSCKSVSSGYCTTS